MPEIMGTQTKKVRLNSVKFKCKLPSELNFSVGQELIERESKEILDRQKVQKNDMQDF